MQIAIGKGEREEKRRGGGYKPKLKMH